MDADAPLSRPRHPRARQQRRRARHARHRDEAFIMPPFSQVLGKNASWFSATAMTRARACSGWPRSLVRSRGRLPGFGMARQGPPVRQRGCRALIRRRITWLVTPSFAAASRHGQPRAVLLGRAVGVHAVDLADRADAARGPGLALTGRHAHPVERGGDVGVGPARRHAAPSPPAPPPASGSHARRSWAFGRAAASAGRLASGSSGRPRASPRPHRR